MSVHRSIRTVRLLALLLLGSATAIGETATFTPSIPDVEVVTHEGKKVRFYSDLVKGKVSAVNFVYTNCSTICPASGALFGSLQKKNPGVQFISVSIDPTVDTPQRLASWSKPFRTQDGWTLVTGDPAAIEQIARAFGTKVARPQDHVPLTIVGSDRTHTWTRLYGFPGSGKIAELVDAVSKGTVKK